MRRRLVPALSLVAAVLVVSACNGADAKRAKELLAQATAAQAKVVSASYDVRVVVSAGSQRYTMLMHGGGYFKGPRAGDQFMSMRGEGLLVPMSFQLVSRGGRAAVTSNGRTQSFPMPAGGVGSQTSNWTAIVGDLAKYVKEVDVQESSVVSGTRGSTVTGVIDTEGLVKAAAGMSIFSQAAGAGSPAFDEMTKTLGDTRVVLFVSERTHLIRTATITLELKGAGQGAKVQVFYGLRGVNRPVSIPANG
jgi:outer membrane lipoprotein-sorting protein